MQTPICIVGMGVSGEAAMRLLRQQGVPKDQIITFDDKAGRADFHDGEKLLHDVGPRTLVVSPGVPLATPWIAKALAGGVELTSELTIAWEALGDFDKFFTHANVIGVTGSVGKSTVVSLLGAGLEKFASDSFVGGNIGKPLADYACELLSGKRPRAPWIVLELSSYQLENFVPFRCGVAVMNALTANHMERYASVEEYYSTKWQLVERATKSVVLNARSEDLKKFAKERFKTKKFSGLVAWVDRDDPVVGDHELEKARLLGGHNQDNLALAAKVATLLKWPKEAFEGMREFGGLPHRVENLGVRSGVRFVNDSKSTTMESVRTAVASVKESVAKGARLFVLLGGKDKNLPWEELRELVGDSQLQFVFFGDCGALAQKKSTLPAIGVFPKLEPALAALVSKVKPADTVLLSPGGTSLDEFKNFEERGERFRSYVHKLF